MRTIPTVSKEADHRGTVRHCRLARRLAPRYNIAPTQPVPVIRQHPKEPVRQISLMQWGLIPSWAKDTSGAARMINARSETAHTLPAFREAMKLRRCLVPADGFYEWQRDVARRSSPSASKSVTVDCSPLRDCGSAGVIRAGNG